MRLIAAILLSAVLAWGADVSGNWAGKTRLSLSGHVEEDTMFLTLQQAGEVVTGTAGPAIDRQAAIRNGKIDGNHLTFELPVPDGVFQFDVNLEDGKLKGSIVANAQGQSFKAAVEVARTK